MPDSLSAWTLERFVLFKSSYAVAIVFPDSPSNPPEWSACRAKFEQVFTWLLFSHQNQLEVADLTWNLGTFIEVCHCSRRPGKSALCDLSVTVAHVSLIGSDWVPLQLQLYSQEELLKMQGTFYPRVSKYYEILRQRFSFLCLWSIFSPGLCSFLRTAV